MSAQVSDDPLVRVDITRTKDQEFTAFVQDAGPYLYKTALFLSGDPHRAEELVQATFERSYRSWHKARAGEPRAYARRILINLRIDGWRRTRHEVVAEAVPPGSVVGPADGVAVRIPRGKSGPENREQTQILPIPAFPKAVAQKRSG